MVKQTKIVCFLKRNTPPHPPKKPKAVSIGNVTHAGIKTQVLNKFRDMILMFHHLIKSFFFSALLSTVQINFTLNLKLDWNLY